MADSENPLVSVVTPVYNGAKYLSQCIENVLSQTYPAWEYIIIDNRSTDDSLKVARRYADQDPRVRVYENETFVDMAENHNIALRRIARQSKYCKVVHADDWIFPQCLAQMVELCERHPRAGVVGAYGLYGSKVRWDGLPYPSSVVSGKEVCRRTLLGGFYVWGSPTSLLIRSDLLRRRSQVYNGHPFHTQYKDVELCYELLQDSDFGFVHQVLTFTRDHEESATARLERTGWKTELPAQLLLLIKYGPVYLAREEYEARLEQLTNQYYAFLGQSLFFHCRDREFWSYHRNALRYLGRPLSVLRLTRSASAEVFDTLWNPLRMARKTLGLF